MAFNLKKVLKALLLSSSQPLAIKDIQAAGRHEIGVHGWIHERLPLLNDPREEQRLLNQSIELLTKMTGRKPVGYRAPSWQFSFWTLQQIKDAGFLYDSTYGFADRNGFRLGVADVVPLWDAERLREIWRFNTGTYDHLLPGGTP